MDALSSFVFNLLSIVLSIHNITIHDLKYRETSTWYSYYRGCLQEGIIPKALRILDNVKIISATPLSLLAEVPSETSNKVYTVKVLLNPEKRLIDFSCTCPWGEFRARPCKHVLATVISTLKNTLNIDKHKIIKGREYISYADPNVYTLLTVIHKALNKSAYFKVKLGEQFT